MNIRSFQHFLALANHLHYGRASDACHISTSALSRNIRQLEQALGAPLFDRDNRHVTLTTEGKAFQKYARNAVSEWALVQSTLGSHQDLLKGTLSLYCSVTASYSILYDLLNRFRANQPSIDIQLHTGDPEHAISRVLAGHEDISIAAHPNSLPEKVAFKPITVSPLVFIAPVVQSDPSVPVTPPESAKAWSEVPMILSETGIARNRVNHWFRERGVSPRIYAQVEGYEAIVSMVSLGLGVGVVPKIVLDHSPLAERIQILSVLPELKPFNIGLFTLKRRLKSPLVNAFWELV